MTYPTQRDAILVHAKAAALAADAKWTNAAIGIANPDGRCVRVYYGGEAPPPKMPERMVLNGEMVGERVYVSAFWPLPSTGTGLYEQIDTEMWTFKHELRTRLQGDSQLGGAAVDLDVEYADPDIYVIGSTRYVRLDTEVLVSYTEYARTP